MRSRLRWSRHYPKTALIVVVAVNPERRRRINVDDVEILNAWHGALLHKKIDTIRVQILAHTFLVRQSELINPAQFISLMDQHPAIKDELIEVIEWRLEQTIQPYFHLYGTPSLWALSLHNRYSRSDIITAISYANAIKRPVFKELKFPSFYTRDVYRKTN